MTRNLNLSTAAFLSLALAALAACDDDPNPPATTAPAATATAPMEEAVAIDLDDPEQCASCHAEVVKEWKESMHSMAHESKDPIFGGMRELRMKKQGAEVGKKCATCHYPRAMEPARAKMAVHGVSCASCHLVEKVGEGKGAAALTWAKNVMAGPHDLAPGVSPAHGTGPAPDFMKDGSSLCLACHEEMSNPAGAPSCTTGLEWKEADAGTCVSCHMPEVKKPSGSVSQRGTHRSHQFLGPHRAWLQDDPAFLAQAVELSAKLVGDDLEVTLESVAGHSFPSGFPGRLVAVVVEGKDEGGKTVWSSIEKGLAQHPEALLRKVYVDADGKPVPAPFAKELKSDTRLAHGEKRTITFAKLPPEATHLEVQLRMFLLPPPLSKTLGLEGPETKPVTFQKVTVPRSKG